MDIAAALGARGKGPARRGGGERAGAEGEAGQAFGVATAPAGAARTAENHAIAENRLATRTRTKFSRY
eukprot:SAG31_NODE_620_length_13503_cov_11.724112_5_plen_68_part_00